MINSVINLMRYSDSIASFQKHPIQKGSTLLIGSSFFANWGYDRVRQNFAQETGKRGIVNHGFGGAVIDEILYHYHRIVYPYEPTAVLLRTGINDIFNGFSPEQAFFLFDRLVTWIHADFPDADIVSLPIFELPYFSKGKDDELQSVREYNHLMLEYAQEHQHLRVWDISPFFYKTPNNVGTFSEFKTFFHEDGLHITQEGYDQFESFFRSNMPNLI